MNQNRNNEKLKKNTRLSVKISQDEKSIIQLKSKNAGYKSTSKYIRDVLLKTNIVPRSDIDLIMQVRKIGVNINQISKLCNEIKDVGVLTVSYDSISKEVNNLIKIVSKICINNDSGVG